MSSFLLQNTASSIIVFCQDQYLGTPVTTLVSTDITCSLKKSTDSLFLPKSLTAATNATADIGSGANGTVTVAVPGTAGNLFTVQVFVPPGTSTLSATIVGTVISVNLSVVGGVVQNADNTATLVAQAINNVGSDLVSATASGSGVTPLTIAQGPITLVGGTNGDFVHIGGGSYRVALSAVDTNTLGALYVRITGPDIAEIVEASFVAASVPVVPPTGPSLPTTTITGYVFNTDTTPAVNVCVTARILSVPTIDSGVAITQGTITVRTDSAGYFTLTLLTGAQVDISIPSVGYRRTITVPASSSNLFDIP